MDGSAATARGESGDHDARTRFDLVTPEGKIAVFSALIGRVNVYNILAAAGAGYARGCDCRRLRGDRQTGVRSGKV
jgi:UDP-N-acetylmuramyl tripeptide synthase